MRVVLLYVPVSPSAGTDDPSRERSSHGSAPQRSLKAMPNPQLVIKSSPHLRTEETTPRIMWIVVATLVPALLMGFWAFGPRAILLTLATTLGALVAEAAADRWRTGSWRMPTDGSALLTGMLLAMCLPPTFPYFEAFLGGVVAIALGKQVFGGLGWNIFNPALVGRAFLQAAFPVEITTWSAPMQGSWFTLSLDALTGATPLAQMKFENVAPALQNLIVGTTGGSMGETSGLLLIIGGLVLVALRIVDWRVPVAIIGTVFVFTGILNTVAPESFPDPLSQIFAGGLMLGAWYMATDMVSSPITARGRVVFAVAIGILVVVIRTWGGLPEGVMYSILLMNAFTPVDQSVYEATAVCGGCPMKTGLRLVLVLTVTAVAAAAALAGVYGWAKPKIDYHRQVALEKAIRLVHPGTEKYTETERSGMTVYVCFDADSNALGYAIPTEGTGYQGTIRLMFGITPDLDRITGLEVLEHAETPGLGGLIESPSFTGKFRDIVVGGPITLVKNQPGDKGAGVVDAITGATISSRAVVTTLNNALEDLGGF